MRRKKSLLKMLSRSRYFGWTYFQVGRDVLIAPLGRLRTARPTSWWRTGRVVLSALAVALGSHSLLAQSPRLEVIHAMLQRPNDPWPRGQGHVLLAVPGCPEAGKGYHETGGRISHGFGM